MADNVTLNAGSGGATLATDDIGGIHWQKVKIAHGADDTATIVTTSAGLPVDLRQNNLSGNLNINIAASGATVTVDSELTTADLDTGAGTDTRAVVGLVRAESGGAVLVGSANPLPTLATISGAIPAGTNNIGDVDVLTLPALPAGTNNIGDVDVLTLPALPAGTNNIGDVDVLSIIPGTGANNLGKAEDGAHTTADVGVMVLAVRTDTATNRSGADGDYEPLQVANGRLWASATIDAALPAGTNNIGDVDIASLPNEGQQTMANSISVAIASDQSAVTVTGTVTVAQATAANLNAQVVGSVAHDAADAGNPIKVGAVARTTLPTAVAGGDRVDLFADDLGRIVTYDVAPRDRIVHNRIALTDTTETTLIAAGGAGVLRDLVDLTISNESSSQVRVDIRDATAGTVRYSVALAASAGGVSKTFRVPLTQAAANTAWTAQLSTAVSTVYVNAEAVEQN